ncbi:bifunctional methylenetetrahydrofolate dehydrogenase/methenyltetrahydrofolate cyclohydrolase FolD [Pseudomonadota bacterium]
MMSNIIDGTAFASRLCETATRQTSQLKSEFSLTPTLAVVLVGDDPASQVYVRNKGKQVRNSGMLSQEHLLPASTSEIELLDLIRELNNENSVHGILVQLPLPSQINPQRVIDTINPAKDVDGFHVTNVGKLVVDEDGIIPGTPLGCLLMLKEVLGDLTGLQALVIGRSNIVGKPMAALLLRENCTVTVAHSHTRNLAEQCQRADILIAAVGRPKMVKGDWIKPGATVIDVGINRITLEDGKSRLVGDVDFDSAKKVSKHITPVPGGVGPVTIACLLLNTISAACKQRNLDLPD